MAQMTYSLRMDKTLKEQFDEICEELGLTATTAINVFARTLVKERRIPFIISTKDSDITYENALSNFKSMQEDVKTSKFAKSNVDDIDAFIKKVRKSK